MALSDGDFFAWYNAEISRYRDHEWQLTSYSIGLSAAVLLFAKGADTQAVVAPWIAATAIGACVVLLLIAQLQAHRRLNQFRARRDLLIHGKEEHRSAKVTAPLICNGIDGFYLCGFALLPAAFGVGAMLMLLE